MKYTEQAVETLDDAGSVIANKNIEIEQLRHRVAELEKELERERMRLAACSTAALGYFEGCCDEYKSASLDDVLRLREANKKLTAERDELIDDKERWSLELMDAAKIAFERTAQITSLKSALREAKEAFQTHLDEHDECTDADGWMAMVCSIEAHHVADEAISTITAALGEEK